MTNQDGRRQRADKANPALVVPVRLRDGDACRYCGRIVNWLDRKSALSGTYDHVNPDAPTTVDTMVVACGSCAQSPADRPPLRPAPHPRHFSAESVEMLSRNGIAVEQYDPYDDDLGYELACARAVTRAMAKLGYVDQVGIDRYGRPTYQGTVKARATPAAVCDREVQALLSEHGWPE